jgi:rhodanese-related sulfurtransferase
MSALKPTAKSKKAASRFVARASWFFLALLAAGAAYALYAHSRSAQPAPAVVGGPLPLTVDVDTAYVMYNHGAWLLDVRTRAEFQTVSILEAINIPLDELAGRLDEIPTAGEIVVVDDGGGLASRARDVLLEAGFARVTALSGGLEAWILERNYPFQGVYPR